MPVDLSTPASTEVGRMCSRNVMTIGLTEDLTTAARAMRTGHVGFLVVRDEDNRRVVGVLTDRDVVVSVVAREADPRSLKVADVMTRNPLLISEDCALDATLGFMRDAGVRRVPVVRGDHELVGVLSLDDVLERMAHQLTSVVSAYRSEVRTERAVRP